MQRKSKVTIPGYVSGLDPAIEGLIFRFENARRRAYSMEQKGIGRLTILKHLTREVGVPPRYVSTAYGMVKALPPHVTFGGRRAQQLRQQGKISHEEASTKP